MKEGDHFWINGRFKIADPLYLYRSDNIWDTKILGRSQIYVYRPDLSGRLRRGSFGYWTHVSSEKVAIMTRPIRVGTYACLKDGNLVYPYDHNVVYGIVMPQFIEGDNNA